jgi:zinc protease
MTIKRIFSCLTLLLFFPGISGAASPSLEALPAGYQALRYPPLRRVIVHQPVRRVLANGMVILYFPVVGPQDVTISVRLRIGSVWEPPEKAGLAWVAGRAWTAGPDMKGLIALGANVETNFGEDSGSITCTVSKEHLLQAMPLLAGLLQHPVFPQNRIAAAVLSLKSEIADRNAYSPTAATRELRRCLLGPDSPYGRLSQPETIDRITREDVLAFYHRQVSPTGVILALWGELKIPETHAALCQALDAWTPKVPGRIRLPLPSRPSPGLHFFPSDQTQCWILLGVRGPGLQDPQAPVLEVLSTLLGKGFSSRLFNTIRSQQGLAYAIYSEYPPAWAGPACFSLAASTRSAQAGRLLNAMQAELASVVRSGITEPEFERAKNMIIKSEVFDFDSAEKIMNRQLALEFYGYPHDFQSHYQARLRQVTRNQVQALARELLQPDRMSVIIFGNTEARQQFPTN